MKHYIYLLLAVIMFAACGSSKKVESSQKLVLKDSVNIRDSIVFKDSTIIRYELNVIDSVNIKDSTVLTLDKDGNVLSKEKYQSTERNRKASKNESTAQTQHETNKQKANERHDQRQDEQKEIVKSQSGYMDKILNYAFWLLILTCICGSVYNAVKKGKKD